VSFANATLVLAIGDTVEEVQDSGFLGTAQTLAAGLVGDDSLVQVHPDGIRHIRADKRIQEWRPPSGKKITHASLNPQQVVIGCPGGEMFYFEIDASGALAEIDKYNLGREIVALEIAPLQAGSIRSQFVAAADPEGRVRLYSLTGQTLTAGITLGNTGGLAAIATQVLPARARSLCMAWTGTSQNTLTLAVGTVNGLLIRATIDSVSGQITDARTRLLGAKPVKLVKTIVKGTSAILALSSRTWVMFTNQGRLQTAPLSYVPVEHASSFSSEQCAEGVVCISRDVVRIFTLDRLEDTFNHSEIPLRYTPRKFEVHPSSNNLIILETDHNAYSHFDRENFKNQLHPEIKVKKEDEMDVDGEQQMPPLPLELDQIIDYRAGKGRWASCLRLFDASQNRTLDLVELEDNEAALCMCLCGFHDREGELFLCVGTVKDLVYEPQRQFSAAFVHVYRVTDQGRRLTLLHKTQVDDMPGAIHGFQGRLLVGAGKALRLYDLGKKRLLKKAENKSFPNQIVSLAVQGSRIIVGDVQDSVLFAKYSKPENSFFIFADDPVPRWMSTFDVLDYDTIVGGDKFGNIFVLRLPDKVGEEVDNDPNGSRFWEIGNMNGAQYKLELVAHYFVGEAVTKVTKTSLTPGGSELILYTTISGTIGALLPFSSREDVDVFSKLEMHLRQENTPLCGRDHLAFRGYYNPVKSVVDGDLCEQFPTLDMDKQRKIAEDFVRTVQEVQKKVEDIRNAV
jgi:splicing factor 3B subunit 3